MEQFGHLLPLLRHRTGKSILEAKPIRHFQQYASALLLAVTLCAPVGAFAGPRDAVAVLNRCGKPLKGDETDLNNTDSHRILSYERGTLYFTRVGNDGWSFVSGTHKKVANLNADEMAKFLPCLPLALADSAAPEPIKPVTPIQRVEVSMKHSYQTVILAILGLLVLLGSLFYVFGKRRTGLDEDDE